MIWFTESLESSMSYNFTFDTAKIRFLGEYQSKNCSKNQSRVATEPKLFCIGVSTFLKYNNTETAISVVVIKGKKRAKDYPHENAKLNLFICIFYFPPSANLFFISATLQKYLLISRGLPDGLSL